MDIRLLNQMGGGNRKWSVATSFVVSDLGIVFGAPDMVGENHLKDTGDAKVLKKTGLRALIDDPANLIKMEIVPKPPTEMTGFSHKASTAVARQILCEMGSRDLLTAVRKHGIQPPSLTRLRAGVIECRDAGFRVPRGWRAG